MSFGNYFKSWYFHIVLDPVQVNGSLPLSKPHLNTALKLFDFFFFFFNPFNTSALPNSRSAIQHSLLQPTLPWGPLPPSTSCCPGCNIPFCTLSLSHSPPGNRCKKIKNPLIQLGFSSVCTFLFATPMCQHLLSTRWWEGALMFTLLAVYSVKQELYSEGQQKAGECLKHKFCLHFVGLLFLKQKFHLKCQH